MYNTIYPNYIKSYYGVNNRPISTKQEDEKRSGSSNGAEDALKNEKQPQREASYFPNGEKTAIDYSRKRIGIDQILADFKNTTNAIGAPDEIKEEVSSYLKLIENQAKKTNPNSQIIQANLKNASQILDEYITNTLKKPSKVVENWVDALFLQQIDYKSQKQEAVIKEPVKETSEEITAEEKNAEETAVNNEPVAEENNQDKSLKNFADDIYVPEDAQLRKMFIQAKKYAAIDRKEQALYSFQNTLDYADSIGDTQACAMISFEQGRIYDEFNQYSDALSSYNMAAKQSNNNNIKAKAHHLMGKIYDDFVYFEPADEHYCAAVSFAGESDNLKLQTKVLSDLAKLHAGRYDKEKSNMFMDLSLDIAEETKDDKVKGIIYSRNADICEKLGDKFKALSMYGNSASAFSSIQDYESLAKNYMNAANIMKQYGNIAKAKKLLSKAYISVQKTDNDFLKNQINKAIVSI